MPKLKSTLIHIDDSDFDSEEFRKALQKRNLDLEFTNVGRFKVTHLPKDIDIRVKHDDLATIWDLVESTPATTFRTGTQRVALVKRVLFMPAILTLKAKNDICKLFWIHSGSDRVRAARQVHRIPRFGGKFELQWLEPENRDARTYEFITACLLKGED